MGVGSRGCIRNSGIRRSSADTSARAAVAALVDAFVARLFRHYQAAEAAEGREVTATSALVALSQVLLSKTTIAAHWVAADGTAHTQARLALADVRATITELRELNGPVRAKLLSLCDRAFDEAEAARR